MPSLIMPPASVIIPRSQRFWRPDAHQWQVPHEGMKETATWSPSATCVTFGPTSVTIPAPSCPPTTGNMDFTPIIASTSGVWLMSPLRRCSSEWHMPDQTIFTRTSRFPGGSISISSVFHGSLSPVHTAARVVDMVSPSQRPRRSWSRPQCGQYGQYRPTQAGGTTGGRPRATGGRPPDGVGRVQCVRARPQRLRRSGGPGAQLGAMGPRRRDRHAQPGRRRGPAPRGRIGRLGPRLRPRPAALGGRGDPARVRRGPDQSPPHHGEGQRPRDPGRRLGVLQRGRVQHGHPERDPLGRARPCQLRRRPLQRLPRRRRVVRAGPPDAASTSSGPS